MECHLEDPLTAGLQIDLHTVAGPAISGTHHWRLFPSSQNIEVLPVNRVTSWVRRKLWNKMMRSGESKALGGKRLEQVDHGMGNEMLGSKVKKWEIT